MRADSTHAMEHHLCSPSGLSAGTAPADGHERCGLVREGGTLQAAWSGLVAVCHCTRWEARGLLKKEVVRKPLCLRGKAYGAPRGIGCASPNNGALSAVARVPLWATRGGTRAPQLGSDLQGSEANLEENHVETRLLNEKSVSERRCASEILDRRSR